EGGRTKATVLKHAITLAINGGHGARRHTGTRSSSEAGSTTGAHRGGRLRSRDASLPRRVVRRGVHPSFEIRRRGVGLGGPARVVKRAELALRPRPKREGRPAGADSPEPLPRARGHRERRDD